MEVSPAAIAPLLLRNLLTSIFICADKPLVFFSRRYKLLEHLRHVLVSVFLFFLRVLPSLFPSLNPAGENSSGYPFKPKKGDSYVPESTVCGGGSGGGSGIARALSQVLSIVNDIPVSSRKYDLVRSLAERLIDENLLEGGEALKEVNCGVLSAAFSRTLSQLEAILLAEARGGDCGISIGEGNYQNKLGRVFRAVKTYGGWRRGKSREELSRLGTSAEKLAAELLWLGQKMAACGCAEEAVGKWTWASNLAWLSLSADPRLQGSLVKVSAFLFKQAKELGKGERDESRTEQRRKIDMRLLMSWLPLLCRASTGVDAPVLSISERAELERVMEKMIESLEHEEEQEMVLSLWLHHFTYCPSSDWPNLHDCYTRWCSASRKHLMFG